MPLGAGQRKWMGERFAAMECAFALATVAQRVDQAATPDPDPQASPSVTLQPKHAVRAQPRPLAA